MTKTNAPRGTAATAIAKRVKAKATAATAAKATRARLDTIAECMGNEHELRGKLIATVKAAGGDHDAVKKHVWAVRIALTLPQIKRLNVSMDQKIEKAKAVLAKKGYKAGAPTKDMQTEEEHKACGAARTYWSRLLIEAGLKTTETRGGANNRDKAAHATDKPATAPAGGTAIAIPAAVNKVEVHKFLQDMAALLITFANKNGKAMDVRSRNLITTFAEDAGQLDK